VGRGGKHGIFQGLQKGLVVGDAAFGHLAAMDAGSFFEGAISGFLSQVGEELAAVEDRQEELSGRAGGDGAFEESHDDHVEDILALFVVVRFGDDAVVHAPVGAEMGGGHVFVASLGLSLGLGG
jgi:hypothetical protein